jgi:hypothetical protein
MFGEIYDMSLELILPERVTSLWDCFHYVSTETQRNHKIRAPTGSNPLFFGFFTGSVGSASGLVFFVISRSIAANCRHFKTRRKLRRTF